MNIKQHLINGFAVGIFGSASLLNLEECIHFFLLPFISLLILAEYKFLKTQDRKDVRLVEYSICISFGIFFVVNILKTI